MVVVWVHDDSRIVVVVVEGLSSWWRQVGGEGFGINVSNVNPKIFGDILHFNTHAMFPTLIQQAQCRDPSIELGNSFLTVHEIHFM